MAWRSSTSIGRFFSALIGVDWCSQIIQPDPSCMVEVAGRRKVISRVFEGLKMDDDYSILNMPIHEVSLVIIGPRVVVDVVSQIIIQPHIYIMMKEEGEGAALRSFGSKRTAPNWWRDSQNRATS